MTRQERLEILCCIIECFEEFLGDRGIDIYNFEKEQDPNASLIYGSDYGDLEFALEDTLIKCGLFKEEVEEHNYEVSVAVTTHEHTQVKAKNETEAKKAGQEAVEKAFKNVQNIVQIYAFEAVKQ